jgi:hypothetical protein
LSKRYVPIQEFQLSQVDIISEIDAEISRLEQAKQLLSGTTPKRGPGRPPLKVGVKTAPKKKRSRMSPEARARIAAAQRARWAKTKKTAGKGATG